MNNTIYSFLLTFFAGLSTLLGCFLIFIKTKQKDNIIIGSLSFAAGVMICVSLMELLPEGLSLIQKKYNFIFSFLICLIFLNIGIIVSQLIDRLLPGQSNKLYKIGLISCLAIILHNIPEGIATFLASNTNRGLGLSLAIAISLHNIPEGISISIPIYYATKSRGKAIFYTLLSGLSEPFGALLAFLFLKPIVTNTIMGALFCFIAGIMIHISIYELLKEAKTYQKRKLVVYFFMIGFLFMGMNQILFS